MKKALHTRNTAFGLSILALSLFGAVTSVQAQAVVVALLPMTACFDPRRHAQATCGLFAGHAAPRPRAS